MMLPSAGSEDSPVELLAPGFPPLGQQSTQPARHSQKSALKSISHTLLAI